MLIKNNIKTRSGDSGIVMSLLHECVKRVCFDCQIEGNELRREKLKIFSMREASLFDSF